MPIELPPQYEPKTVEKGIYKRWLDAGAFHAVPDSRGVEKRFSMVIPPPNVTGALHLGHAINGTIQDILARYHRMNGDNTLWMPGIDHAGIATQAVVEKTIFEKERKNRHDLGREELVRRIWEWKEQFGTRILNQLESIGASCDWTRTRFTLDEVCAKAVREAFFKMFKDGLIFRGKRLVNWDTHLQTAVADDEIYHETVKGQMTSIKYPVLKEDKSEVKEGKNGEKGDRNEETGEYLVVATTRPETMLGDTAVAVHPEDPRYKHLIGKFVILPLVGRKIPVIADGLLVDPKFGTGVVKVTPAHDPNDYATGQRHGLEMINLLTADGKCNENGAGEFRGVKYSYVGLKFATAARQRVLADLEGLGLVVEKKVHEHEVGHSDRSKTPIEPYLSDQWFVRMGDVEETRQSEPRPSGSDRVAKADEGSLPDGRGSEDPPHSNALAYFITFHTYATWLHGQEPGAVDPEHNDYDTPFIPPNPKLLEIKLSKTGQPPLEFSVAQRQSVLNTLQEVATFRSWKIHAVNVRSTHVHIVVSGKHAPERMMNDFKSYATRRMVEASLLPKDTKAWSRHGSTRYLWKSEHVSGAIQYTLHGQGDNPPGTSAGSTPEGSLPYGRGSDEGSLPYGRGSDEGSLPYGRGSDEGSLPYGRGSDEGSLPYGRGSDFRAPGVTLANGQRATGLAQAAIDAVTSGRVKITPERYAKGYIDWLSQKRDWCISRQLWWGHRIPVWSHESAPGAVGIAELNDIYERLGQLENEGRIALWVRYENDPTPRSENERMDWKRRFYCVKSEEDKDAIDFLEKHGFVHDPDVLDTWFSSALWPISTMGWPGSESRQSEARALGSERTAPLPEGSLPHGRGSDGLVPEPGLLSYFYPTSVLSTAREILTLWVARMVMFGLYCRGDVPFKDVYIHAVIQDGEGRPMKKSLGNGVDPVDIVASHGADALRFTLAAMATETQDIRLPVVKDAASGHNTSPKFDLGRNFANKVWNASRFILMNVGEGAGSQISDLKSQISDFKFQISEVTALEDRWILSRLNSTVRAVSGFIEGYRFAEMAEALRSFFWTDLCDWYLEIAKARIKGGDEQVRAILLHCLRTSLKMLHPVMPFITEELWGKLEGVRGKGLGDRDGGMLITAVWPVVEESQIDAGVEGQLALIQSVTSAIREIQNRYPAAKGKDVIVAPRDEGMRGLLERSRGVIEALAGAKLAAIAVGAAKPENAAASVLPEAQIFIAGVIEKGAETAKLTKRQGELEKFIAAGKAKLANQAAVAKAPANVVQGWRDQLAKQEEELAAVVRNLAELGN